MAFDEQVADRVRALIALTHKKVKEKKMFGGLSFMVNDKICVSVKENKLMVRHDPDLFEELAEKDGCNPMVHSGKIMKGFLFVDIDTVNSKKKLEYWVNLALEYNARAQSTKPAKITKKKK